VFDQMHDHNLVQLLDAGLLVTVNSGRSRVFRRLHERQLRRHLRCLPLGLAHAQRLARNGFIAAFLPQAQKEAFLATVDAYSHARRRPRRHAKPS
jgi:adenosine deaminase